MHISHEEFVTEYNSMIRPDVDENGRPLPLEKLTPEVLTELMPMISDMMKVNCGTIHNFDFIDDYGHIKLIGGKFEEY